MAEILPLDGTPEHVTDRAERAFAGKRYGDALSLLHGVLAKYPGFFRARILLGDVYAALSLPDDAADAYFAVLADHPDFSVSERLVRVLMRSGHSDAARHHAEACGMDRADFFRVLTSIDLKILSDPGPSPAPEFTLREGGLSCGPRPPEEPVPEDAGDSVSAPDAEYAEYVRGVLKRAAEAGDPGFSEYANRIADSGVCGERDVPPGGRRLVQLYPPTDADCVLILSMASGLMARKDFSHALGFLDRILPENGEYYLDAAKQRASAHIGLQDTPGLLEAATAGLKHFPDDLSLLCYRYMALKLTGGEEEADALFDQRIRGRKPSPGLECLVKTDACRMAMCHEDLAEAAGVVLEDSPLQPAPMLLRGRALFNSGRRDEARAAFRETLRIHPDCYEARYLLNAVRDGFSGTFSYSLAEMNVECMRIFGKAMYLSKNPDRFNEWLSLPGSFSELEYALANATERVACVFASVLGDLVPGPAESLIKKMLLKSAVPPYLPPALLAGYMRNGNPERIAVVTDRRLKIVEMPSWEWRRGLSAAALTGACVCMIRIIIYMDDPDPRIGAAAERLSLVSAYLEAPSDRETADYFMNSADADSVMLALTDIVLERGRVPPKGSPEREKYNKAYDAFKRVEKDHDFR